VPKKGPNGEEFGQASHSRRAVFLFPVDLSFKAGTDQRDSTLSKGTATDTRLKRPIGVWRKERWSIGVFGTERSTLQASLRVEIEAALNLQRAESEEDKRGRGNGDRPDFATSKKFVTRSLQAIVQLVAAPGAEGREATVFLLGLGWVRRELGIHER
jgi:hypothetical protein